MKKNKIITKIRIPAVLHRQILIDLKREHKHAAERVGFLFTRCKRAENITIVTGIEYIPVNDKNYDKDSTVGASINSTAMTEAMQKSLDDNYGCFHVHLHSHLGEPYPSRIDAKSLPPMIKSIANINKRQVHGILILSEDAIYTQVLSSDGKSMSEPELASVVGYPMILKFPESSKREANEMYHRQMFLGENSNFLFENITIGIIGYGGGGSHIGQQLAHLGFQKIMVFDEDIIESTNLNRLVGGQYKDLHKKTLKTSIAKRQIKGIKPKANVTQINDLWQKAPHKLMECDIVVGCIDSLLQRDQLEAMCRRYLIPYVDIGMDVIKKEDEPYYISGQVILSMPGMPCMKCMGLINDNDTGKEAAKYGNTGGNPQVVWSNGILASFAVGVLVDLITNWTLQKDKCTYLAYDGNQFIIKEHINLRFIPSACEHYPIEAAGEVILKKL